LDKQLSTGSAFLIACALIGIFTGAYSAYKLLSKVINNNNKRT
jgi:succinate-acetate transporter protein